jgi:hypothetical protein
MGLYVCDSREHGATITPIEHVLLRGLVSVENRLNSAIG